MGKFGLMFAERGEKCALCHEALWAGELASSPRKFRKRPMHLRSSSICEDLLTRRAIGQSGSACSFSRLRTSS